MSGTDEWRRRSLNGIPRQLPPPLEAWPSDPGGSALLVGTAAARRALLEGLAAGRPERGTIALTIGGLRGGLVPVLLREALIGQGVLAASPDDFVPPGLRAVLKDLRGQIADLREEGILALLLLDDADGVQLDGDLGSSLRAASSMGASLVLGSAHARAPALADLTFDLVVPVTAHASSEVVAPAPAMPAVDIAGTSLGSSPVSSWTPQQLEQALGSEAVASWRSHWSGVTGFGIHLDWLRRALIAALADESHRELRIGVIARSVLLQSSVSAMDVERPVPIDEMKALLKLRRAALDADEQAAIAAVMASRFVRSIDEDELGTFHLYRAELAVADAERTRELHAAVAAAMRCGAVDRLVHSTHEAPMELVASLASLLRPAVALTIYQDARLSIGATEQLSPAEAARLMDGALAMAVSDPHETRAILELLVPRLDARSVDELQARVATLGPYGDLQRRRVLDRRAALGLPGGDSPPELDALRPPELAAIAEDMPHVFASCPAGEVKRAVERLERPAALASLLSAAIDDDVRRQVQSALARVVENLVIERWDELDSLSRVAQLIPAETAMLACARLLTCAAERTIVELAGSDESSIAGVAGLIRCALGPGSLIAFAKALSSRPGLEPESNSSSG